MHCTGLQLRQCKDADWDSPSIAVREPAIAAALLAPPVLCRFWGWVMLPLGVITTAAGCSISACAAMSLSAPLPPAPDVTLLLLDCERLRALAAAAAAAAGSTSVMPMLGELGAEPRDDAEPADAVGEPLGLLLP
jgi:hypothetical protein